MKHGLGQMTVSYGDDATVDDSDKKCRIQTTLSYPAGWTFALVWTTYFGYTQPAPTTRQSWHVAYSLNDDTNVTSTTGWVQCAGRHNGEYERESYDGTGSALYDDASPYGVDNMLNYVWSPCGANSTRVNTDYEIRAVAWTPAPRCYVRRRRGLRGVRGVEGIVSGNASLELQVIWKKC